MPDPVYTNFPVKKYATVELNRCGFPDNSLVVSQTPLSSDFASVACENGMWVDADKANGAIKMPTANTVVYGLVYTAEKEWNDGRYGLNQFCQHAGDYPRVGVMQRGDTVTTNCFCYDSATYTTLGALETVLKACQTTPVYVAPLASSGRPVVTASKPNSGFYAKVIAYTKMPNGEKAIKYAVVAE